MRNTNWNTRFIDSCTSTNNCLKDLRGKAELSDRTALVTDFQSSGKGQGENIWFSSIGRNILISLYRKVELPVSQNFMITIIASLAIYKLLEKYKIEAKIKWPNDIYVGDKKITGILIENSLMRDKITDSIIGIGLNVNENNFPDWLPNPCSMVELCGQEFKLKEIQEDLIFFVEELFSNYESDRGRDLFHQYNSLLYRLNNWYLYKYEDKTLNGRIHGVEPDGKLVLETNAGKMLQLMFGEIEYIIK